MLPSGAVAQRLLVQLAVHIVANGMLPEASHVCVRLPPAAASAERLLDALLAPLAGRTAVSIRRRLLLADPAPPATATEAEAQRCVAYLALVADAEGLR